MEPPSGKVSEGERERLTECASLFQAHQVCWIVVVVVAEVLSFMHPPPPTRVTVEVGKLS